MRVLMDTCVWSQFLRRNRPVNDSVAREVARLIRADAVVFAQLRECLRFYPNLPIDEEDDENAAHYYNLCRRQGVQSTATDLLICAVAVRHGLRIFTTDTDFDLYAKHLPITRHAARNR